jgi:biopolymer transport protein ExbB
MSNVHLNQLFFYLITSNKRFLFLDRSFGSWKDETMENQTALWIVAVMWVSRLVLVLLVGLSVWSVSIMIERSRVFRELREEQGLDAALAFIRKGDWSGLSAWVSGLSQNAGIRAKTIHAAMEVGVTDAEAIERSVKSFLLKERSRLEEGLTTLATLGSNAPFIGLFGTVLGIIQAFGALSNSNGNTASVMSGISEALVATAIGLFVAIPAVVAYNVFTRRMKLVMTDCESLRDLLIARRLASKSNS